MPATLELSHRGRLIVIFGLMSGVLLSALDQTIVATALPTIVGDLGGLNHLSWVVTAYMLASTGTMPLYGKVSDLLGRQRVFQAAIVIFLTGSVLCGLAQTLWQLIAFRFVQGLGAGGLMSVSFTIIGDIVPPRERGRYNGYLTGTFALASVLGPLAGGFFVDHASWRWIFYVNLPIGAIALAVSATVLRLPFPRTNRKLDLTGAAILVSAVTCLLLATVWGGDEYAWGSAPIIGLYALAAAGTATFIWWEHRAAEPILPPRLFSNRVVAVSDSLSFLAGAAMFGVIVYIPLFFQGVQGRAATNSGLLLLPMMLALTVGSLVTGRLISRTGRYRQFPIVGGALGIAGLILFSRFQPDTSRLTSSIAMIVVGLGMGVMLPTLTVAVQNAVEPRDLGSGTSSVNFARTLGSTIGVSAFGALLNARLATNLAKNVDITTLPPGLTIKTLTRSPKAIAALPPGIHDAVTRSLSASITTLFLGGAGLMALAFAVAWLLEELPLRSTSEPVAPAMEMI